MDVLGKIVRDWNACNPAAGGTVPGSQLSTIIERALSRVQAGSVTEKAREDSHALLSVHGNGLPPFLRLLHVNGRAEESINFLHFWRAFHELWRRLRSSESAGLEAEPLAEEIVEFRDTLLRRAESHDCLTKRWLLRTIQDTDSADSKAWEPLLTSLRSLVTSADGRVSLEQVTDPILSWLQSTVADYRRGERRSAICAVMDVAGCGMHEACLRLGKHDWDIETTLKAFYKTSASNVPLAVTVPQVKTSGSFVELVTRGRSSFRRSSSRCCSSREESWSTCGAKLRKDEVDCPICMEPYGASPPVQFQCCLQVMCGSCRMRVANQHGCLTCPFCRTAGRLSDSELQASSAAAHKQPSTRRRASRSLSRVCRRVAIAAAQLHLHASS
jgi:hypothetical protein